jgi:tetratricopeptide (TPR) repeat protein
MTKYFDLGSHNQTITTKSATAQVWFNRGIIWCYGFNHEEAIRCFQKVLEQDPECAMGYWGLAYAASSFYNKPWEWFDNDERCQVLINCFDHSQKALTLSSETSPVEQQLIQALCQKHPSFETDDITLLKAWERDYSIGMQAILENHPDDLDVICLTAESMMNLTRWKLWDIDKGIPAPGALTEESIAILEHGMALTQRHQQPPHPGISHFYIHALEMSPQPEKALTAANHLRDLCPESGHLLHMSTHIDILCGDYQAVVEANTRANQADLKYIDLRGKQEFYLISCLHNFHSKIYAAMFLGQFNPAMEAAEAIVSLVTENLLTTGTRYLRTTLEAYYSSKLHVLVRFGLWQKIIDEPLPKNQNLYLITTTLLYYGKGIAYAALGDITRARECKSAFEQLHASVPDWHIIANNPTVAVLDVAAAMLNGELEYHAGNHELGYSFLREASKLSDQLAYAEPWPWMHPPRHALGALLLEQDQVEEAMQHYGDDLGIGSILPRSHQHRDNIWALHGYVECLKKLDYTSQLSQFEEKLQQAMQLADISIESSCCCRKNTFNNNPT